MRQMSKH